MREPADEIAALRAKCKDLLADREGWREVLEERYADLQVAIPDVYALQTFVTQDQARVADERLVPVRQALGWDPYPNRHCPLDPIATSRAFFMEHLLTRRSAEAPTVERLQAEVSELRSANGVLNEVSHEVWEVDQWLRSVAPEGAPYLGKRTDKATGREALAAWREAGEVLGTEVVAPFSLETEAGPLPALALIVGFGAPCGTVLVDLDDFHHWFGRAPAGYHAIGVRPDGYRKFQGGVLEDTPDDVDRQGDGRPLVSLVRASEPLCSIDFTQHEYRPEIHHDAENTDCAAWRLLLELIDEVAEDGREEFAPGRTLPRSFWSQIVTLPPSIGKLTGVKNLHLYGSNLVALPPEVGQMESLEVFTPYTSRRLHWFPYEITRCAALRDSTVSTRHLYGNSKHRMPFPQLPSVVPAGSAPLGCSVCTGPFGSSSAIQVWISLRVATDVLPLLVHACSQDCVRALPRPPDGYVERPHQGGRDLVQPDPRW